MAIDFKKFIKGIVLGNDVDPSKKLQVEVTSSATTGTKTTVQASQTANRTIILPDASDTLVGKATTDTLTNKTFDADGTGNSITNIENADIKSGAAIDAAKLANGSVSNAEFQYLANVTSDIQTQFNNTNTAITDHVNDTTDAHDASAISNVPSGNLAATDQQAVNNELQSDIDTRLLKAGDTMSGNLNMGSNLITSLGTPVSGTDAANKNYVDGISAGLDPKESVRVATTTSVGGSYASSPSNGRFTGAATTVDGVALSVSDRVLIKDQVDQKQNGIYIYTASGEFTRSSDMDGSPASEVSGGNFVFVAQGTTNGASGYVLIANGIVTLNTDNLVFTQFSGGANSANKTLSNLDSPTAINQSLLPGTDNTINLGSAAKRYTTGYMQEQRDASNSLVQSITARTLYDSSGSASIDHSSTSVIAVNSKRISSIGDAVDINDAISKTDLMNALKNYITLGDAVSTVVGANVDTYGSGTTRPAGSLTGVTTGVTFTRSTSSPLTGTGSFILNKDATNRQGRVAYYGFTLQNADKAKVMQIEMDYIVNSGTFVAGSSSTDSDVIMYIHDVTNDVFIEPSSFKLLSNSSTIADKFIANFQTSATGTSYRLLFYISSTSSAAYSLKVDNIAVKPCNYVYGTPITDWRSFTSTITNFTVSSQQSLWRRVGDSMQIRFFFNLNSAVSSTLRFNMPSGYSIDAVKMDYTANDGNVGYATANRTASNNYIGHVQPGNTSGGFRIITNGGNEWTSAVPITWQSGDRISAFVEVPIVGWSSSVQMSDSYDGRLIAAFYSNTPSGTLTNSFNTITFPTKSTDTTASYSSGVYTIPSSGFYDISAGIQTNQNWTTGNRLGIAIRINGAEVVANFTRAPQTTNYPLEVQTSAKSIYLTAGQLVTIASYSEGSGGAFSQSTTGVNFFSIAKVQSSQTISATETIAASYTTTNAQSITAGSTTIVNYEVKLYDSHNAVTTGTGTWRFTAPAPGFYKLQASTSTQGKNYAAGDFLILLIYKNGTEYGWLGNWLAHTNLTGFPTYMGDSHSVYLNSDEYIDVRLNPNTTVSLDNNSGRSHINIERIK